MHHLSIDIETYSPEPIGKAGAFKYAQAPGSEVMLFAYSLDGGPVEIVDLTAGESLPENIADLMFDSDCLKHAYNAAFEWYCLSQRMLLSEESCINWLPQWRCTMLHGLYCGYTAGLGVTGTALGLPEDKRKLTTGKALIRTFCVPCKPTKSNGGRTRTLPHHEPEKWELFKSYCKQDVVTEMEVEKRLSPYPVPEDVQRQWERDQIINLRGVAVDLDLVAGALRCSQQVTEQLTAEAVGLSGLDNPNSVAQLSSWLQEETGETVADLRKETVTAMLGQDIGSGAARRMLEIRQELSKTSVKKYTAMQEAAGADGRVRGLLQFYGANRSGRWAGRLVQVQNLPRTYLPADLQPSAREWVKAGNVAALRAVFGSVTDTLSQLIRTALVPAPGHLFIDADFSAIEARVISWLAGEEWRLEVFRTHGKIYEASASQMFGVPLERITKGNPEYSLRQKGKVAELALGYQGGAGALIRMGALDKGLTEDELPDIVRRWRETNRRVRDLWYAVEAAALQTVQTGASTGIRNLRFALTGDAESGQRFMTVLLPSGRELYYAQPTITTDERGRKQLHYMGQSQTTKRWEPVDTYGGKLVENITQAVARDCLAVSIDRLEDAGYPVVFHVHDEVIIDCPASEEDLNRVCEIMGRPIPWAPGLPLKADGWIGEFYTKD